MKQDANKRTFARILCLERKRRCWTQAEVAEKVDTSSVNVSRWENGISKPLPYHRQNLCHVFGLTYEEFFPDLIDQLQEPALITEEESSARKQPLKDCLSHSSFHFNEPLMNIKDFYGRPREWVTLRSRLLKRSSTSIVGPRRIGKSWLLTYVKLIVTQQFTHHVHFCLFDANMPGCYSLESFMSTIFDELGVALLQISLTSSLIALEKVVRQKISQQQILVLCIDEFERLCEVPDFHLSFLEHLRALTQIGLVLIIASKRPLMDIVSEVLGEQGKTSPFFNVFEQVTLGPFSAYEARKFVIEKSAQADFQEPESEALLRYGQIQPQQWIPLRLQLAGKMLETDRQLAQYEDTSYYRPHDSTYWTDFKQRLEEAYSGAVQQ